jgi:hypothetical protein
VADGKVQRHEPAGGVAEQHRVVDAKQLAQPGDVVGHLLKGAGLDRRAPGAALAAQVDVDDLGVGTQGVQARPQVAMIEARTAVQGHQGRAWPEVVTGEVETWAHDVEVEVGLVDPDAHGGSSWSRSPWPDGKARKRPTLRHPRRYPA